MKKRVCFLLPCTRQFHFYVSHRIDLHSFFLLYHKVDWAQQTLVLLNFKDSSISLSRLILDSCLDHRKYGLLFTTMLNILVESALLWAF